MKRKNLRLSLTSLMVVLLVGVMAVSSTFTAFTGKSVINSIGSTNSAIQQGAYVGSDLKSNLNPDNLVESSNVPKSTDKVELIVTMDDKSLVDTYLSNPGSYESFSDYRLSAEGRNAAENLINRQRALFNKIARQFDVTLEYNYVNVMNGFAMKITYGDRKKIDSIAQKAKIKGTSLAHTYAAPDTTVVENEVSAQSTGIFDSSKSIADGIGGQGTVVAILDTGLDWEHIAFDPNNPIFANDNTYKFSKDYINSKLTQLTAYQNKVYPDIPGRDDEEYDKTTKYLNVNDIYKNSKVPFAYDYADKDPEVNSHYDNLHGTHVAGIIAGHSDDPKIYKTADGKEETYLREVTKDKNGTETDVKYYKRSDEVTVKENGDQVREREYNNDVTDKNTTPVYDKKGEVVTGITGVAPKAQLAIFKVFPDFDAASSSSHLLAALEDCMTLEVDVINMSLGVDCGFQEDSQTRDSIYDVYDKLERSGISLTVAASNSYSSGFNTYYGLNRTSNPDSATVGTPSTYDAAMSVASISGVPSKYLLATNGEEKGSPNYREFGTAYYIDPAHLNGETYDFMEEIYKEIKERNLGDLYIQDDGSLKIPYITISGTGEPANYAGEDVKDKIALVSRGNSTFEDKVKNAAAKNALACIIFNNSSGVIRMNIGDDVTIPACSINMDDAAKIKYMDAEVGEAFFIIDDNAEAGPFMSEFSSWGPMPNLVLKPDITAHGGEIYSAVPGNETSYERMSGTSMACPNMAGVMALLRQYMQTKQGENYPIAEKFGLMKEENGKKILDKELMEQRIDQILMSTATIANNEEGNPYSPRKQGAGLADLEKSRTTEQYIVVKDEKNQELERTKLDLFDDPSMSGVYDMTFYVRNVGSSEVVYSIDSYVLTEGISTNGKTVTEKAHILSAATKEYTVDDKVVADGKIKVPAGQEVKINYVITLGQEDRDWLANFENGMYVEGYICLKNITDGSSKKIDLNIPYLAFYGDWAKAPIFDYDVYEVSADEKDDNINEEDKRYSNTRPLQLIGKVKEDESEYALGIGSFPFVVPDEFEDMVPAAKEDYCALSFNNDACIFNLYGVGGFLRGAKKVFYCITDAVTGEVMLDDVYYCARKAAGAGSVGGAWIDVDLSTLISSSGKTAFNNGRYNVAIYPVLDWCSETYPSDQFLDKEDVIEYFEKYNKEHPDDQRTYVWSSDFWIDTDAPFLSDTKLRIERDKKDNASYFIDFYVTDNHYACGLGYFYWDKDEKEFKTAFETPGLYPLNSDRNATTRVTFEITNLWDQISEGLKYLNDHKDNQQLIKEHPELGTNLTQLHITLYDYAFNRSYYQIDIAELLNGYNELSFGDITNTRVYTNSQGEQVEVMTTVKDTLETLSDGTYKVRTYLNMVPGQKLPLSKAIIPDPVDACRDFLSFSISGDENSVKFNEETNELYALSEGEVSVSVVANKYNGDSQPYATLDIKILSQDEINDLGIDIRSIQAQQTLSGLTFNDNEYGKYFNAGEEYQLDAKADPWYYNIDTSQYFVKWSSYNELLAKVQVTSGNSFSAKVTAANSSYDQNGKYVPNMTGNTNISAVLCKYDDNGDITDDATGKKGVKTMFSGEFTVAVLSEFVTEGNVLTEYHGTGKDVSIPAKDLNVTTIGNLLFYENNDIETITFGEGVDTIGPAACAYMKNLRSVKLPSTLYKIDSNAFSAYYSLENDAPETKLTVIDTTACTERPLEIAPRALSFQRYLGVDLEKSTFTGNGIGEDNEKEIVLIPASENKFYTGMIRVVGEYGMYGLAYLSNIDLSGLRSASTASFYYLGSGISKHVKQTGNEKQYAKVTFGENSFFGPVAFGQNGIGSITLPMKRISQQSFFGAVEFRDDDKDGEEEAHPLYWGELEEITFTADGLVIDDAAFLYSSVKKVKFEGWVDTIGEAAFAGAKNLATVEFCDKDHAGDNPVCRVIGAQAFMETALTEATLPDGLEELGQAAYLNCSKLTKIHISEGCNLLKAYKSDSLNASSGAPFYGCDQLTTFEVDSKNTQLEAEDGILYSKDAANKMLVSVPNNVDFESDKLNDVKEIAPYAFAGNKKLKEIDLSKIESIGDGAFYMCKVLNKVTLPDNLEAIPNGCFIGCEKLTTIDMKNCTNLKKIGESAFANSGLSSVTFSNSTEEIGPAAFMECNKLTVVTIPTRVKVIDEATFYNCPKLARVNFNNVTEIGVNAFTFSGITEVSSANITKVGYAAFAACPDLSKVSLSGVITIDDAAFIADLQGDVADTVLETLNIPNAQTIGVEAFAFQEKITYVDLRECRYLSENAFLGCSGLIRIHLNKIISIGANAFNSCTNLAAVGNATSYADGVAILPSTMKAIDSSAFVATNLAAYYLESEDGDYFVEDGVLYKHVPNGSELVSFPTMKFYPIRYEIREDTVHIANYAFAGIENVIQVDIPDSVESIGDAAFLYSSIKVFNFLGYHAPELEAYYSSYDTDYKDGTRNVFFWQVYRNFCYPFSYSYGAGVFKYNPVRHYQDEELELYIPGYVDMYGNQMTLQNGSYTGGGFSDYDYLYNIVLMYASNATGFDTFVWEHYFDSKVLKPELIEAGTIAVMDLIRALPDVSILTIEDKDDVELARAWFDALTYNQMAFVKDAGLVEVLENCEKQIETLSSSQGGDSLGNTITLLEALPSAANVTENDRAAVEAARAAYDALSDADKNTLQTNNKNLVDNLIACEEKLGDQSDEDNGCGSCESCGTVTFGAGGGGTGLMIGLAVVLLACLAVVLLRKKRALKK